MKNIFDSFEKGFRKKIFSKSEIPEEQLWDRINSYLLLKEKQKKRRRFVFMFGVMSLVVFSGMIMLIINRTGTLNTGDSKFISPSDHTSNLRKRNSTFNYKAKSKLSNTKKESYLEKDSHLKPKHVINDNTNSTFLSSRKKYMNSTSNKSKSELDGEKVENNYLIAPNNLTAKIISAKNLNVNINLNEKNIDSLYVDPNAVNDRIEFSLKKMSVLGYLTLTTVKSTDFKDKILFNQNSRRIYIGLDFLPTISQQKLINTNSSPTLYNNLISNEYGTYNSNFGLTFGMQLAKNINLRTGIQNSKYSTNFVSENSQVGYDSITKTLGFQTAYDVFNISTTEFYNEDSEEEELEFDSEDSSDFVILNYVNRNSVHIISIPLAVEYGMMIKDVRLFISCGMTVGKVTSGYSIIETLGFKSFKKDLEPKLNNWLIGNQVELGSEYFFKNNFSICGSANINYSLNYLTNSTQIRNKPYWIGMKACLRYYFN